MIYPEVSEVLPYPARMRLVDAAIGPTRINREIDIDFAIESVKKEFPSFFRPEVPKRINLKQE